MPTCKKCNQKYPCWVEIDGKQRNLGTRKFCLDCSPFGSHNTRDLTIPKKDKKQRLGQTNIILTSTKFPQDNWSKEII
mgnify:CR=1 FL=1